ncbi:MAG: hypothetical protein Q9228_007745, partial [Teloschistes exilis]
SERETNHLYLRSTVTLYSGLEWAKFRFDTAEGLNRLSHDVNPTQIKELMQCRNSLVDLNPPQFRYEVKAHAPVSGVLSAVFEHEAMRRDGTGDGIRRYGVLRLLKRYEGQDTYGYERYPLLNVRLWQSDSLRSARVVALTDAVLTSMRPLASTALPVDPSEPAQAHIWATIPIDKVSGHIAAGEADADQH